MKILNCILVCGMMSALFLRSEEVKVEASRDVWLSAYETRKSSERDYNMGAATTIKLKMWQEFGIIDFDLSALRGRVVTKAWLYVKPARQPKYGLNGPSDLRWLSVSTVFSTTESNSLSSTGFSLARALTISSIL